MSRKFEDWIKKYNIPNAPLIHIGAHLVQERDEYRKLNFSPVLWFEANPQIAEKARHILKNYPDQELLNKALWSTAGVAKPFYFAGHQGSSSSLLEPYLISASHPEVVKTGETSLVTSTLDAELNKLRSEVHYRVLVLDVQGAEIEVILGGGNTLKNVDYIISEISQIELYRNTSTVKELSKVLNEYGFTFVASEINRATGWGEGLFIKTSLLNDISDLDFDHQVIGKYLAKGRILRTILLELKNIKTRFQRGIL